MRLIDADALEEAVQGAINIMESHGISMISASIPMAIIKGAPTIVSIPVEWLEAQKTKLESNYWIGPRTAAKAIERLIRKWKEEQEAR